MTTNPGDQIEEELRRRLAFHFMDPVDKFIARRQVPWKLLLQFLKGMLIILYFNKLQGHNFEPLAIYIKYVIQPFLFQ